MTRFRFDLAGWFVDNAEQIRQDLTSYFGGGKEPFTGRWFDEFAAVADPNRFEASDVLAVEALSLRLNLGLVGFGDHQFAGFGGDLPHSGDRLA
jgi:uncharacterized protein DUF6308